MVAPYLFLAPLMLMLFQVIVNQFIVIKKTWYNLLALVVGALVNVVLNYILIPLIGIEGAAIGTLVGYIVSIVITATILIRMGLLRISYKFYVLSLSLLAYFLLWRFAMRDLLLIPLVVVIVILFGYCILFRKDIKQLISNK